MNKKEFLNLLQKRSRGELDKIDETKLLRILDQLQRRELDWEMDSLEEEELKHKMKAKIDARLQSRTVSRTSIYGMMKWAASFLLLIGLAYLGYQVQQLTPNMVWEERITNERQKASITLPDGSTVFLNTNTRLRFPREFVNGKREVELDGEAFFEVVKDKEATFEVNSQGVKTVVLGTSFNVRGHEESPVKVAVQSGKVAVFHQTSTTEASGVELQPRQMATAIPGGKGFSIEEMDSDSFLDWRAGSVSFDMDPFDEIIQRLASLYNYKIELEGEGMDQCQIKATYANGNLFAVLYGLKNLVVFDVEKTGERTLKITYKECKI